MDAVTHGPAVSWLAEDCVTRLACALAHAYGKDWRTLGDAQITHYRDKARLALIWLETDPPAAER